MKSSDAYQSALYVASQQQPDGAIPWFDGEHLDPWDHVEAAMALTATGLLPEARRAYRYAADTQRADGSWPMRVSGGAIQAAEADTNQCAYIAVGVWHYWLASADSAFVQGMWPTVRAAIEFVLSLQRPSGEIAWALSCDGRPAAEALLAGNSSTYQALRSAIALAGVLRQPEPDWELAASQLGHALRRHPELFADKSRYSMDWYYPVLAGAVTGPAAAQLIESRWTDFVISGWGIRCVADRPWVTGAETCELILALDACGQHERGLALLADVQHLRHDDGSYWTGYVLAADGSAGSEGTGAVWPVERTTWTAAAVVLAYDALSATSAANGIFRGAGLAPVPPWTGAGCGCRSLVSQ
jgi:hypothetical protein